jgi:hypothetical protein
MPRVEILPTAVVGCTRRVLTEDKVLRTEDDPHPNPSPKSGRGAYFGEDSLELGASGLKLVA